MRERTPLRKTILLLALATVLVAGVLGPSTGTARAAPLHGKSWASWSAKWCRQAHLARLRDSRCLVAYGRPALGKLERTGRDDPAWGRACKHAAVRWNAGARRLLHRMQHPGGSGAARWWPLARYAGWWPWLHATWLKVVTRESGGNPRVLCGGYVLPKNAGDGEPDERAGGLMQDKPAPRHWADPEFNLRYSWVHKFLASLRACGDGWAPWAL